MKLVVHVARSQESQTPGDLDTPPAPVSDTGAPKNILNEDSGMCRCFTETFTHRDELHLRHLHCLNADAENSTCGACGTCTVFCRKTEAADTRQTSTIAHMVGIASITSETGATTDPRQTFKIHWQTTHVRCQGCQRCNVHKEGNRRVMRNCACGTTTVLIGRQQRQISGTLTTKN